jgi:gamma-glutamyltranspeptidase/glutathione hydrolase
VRAAVAAGHPATAAAGADVLADGGSAADAVVAGSLAACVAETVMTGLLGGGHGVYFDAGTAGAHNLDCFVAVPGLGAERREPALVELDVPFGEDLVHYAVGIASCAVPGLPAGLEELWRRYGRLPWPRLVEPALELARRGVVMPRAHASCLEMLAPVLTMNEGARIYAPGGRLLREGEQLEQPGLVRALEALAAEGVRAVYSGSLAEALLVLMEERGGLVTRADLEAYRAEWAEPVVVPYCRTRLQTRGGLSDVPSTLRRLPRLRRLDEAQRAVAWARALGGERGEAGTTNISAVDGEGNACVLTTSLGLGSGDFLPGLDLHLNSMLGEAELVRGPLEPGARMESMMAPTAAVDGDGLVLAAGAAGGSRLGAALLQVVAGVLDEGLSAQHAVERPRLHRIGSTVHLEPGFAEEAVAALERAGYDVRVWPAQHHYFGGVSLVARGGAGADPRRSGAAVVVG